MFDWSGKNADKSGKSQGILISCVSGNPVVKLSSNGCQETLNKCETQNKIVFHIRLRQPETINSVSLNSVSRIRQRDIQPVLHLAMSCFGINLTFSEEKSSYGLFKICLF